ncbi:mitochondrial-processing peptidase subunit alpha-like [Pyrus ussuriensis x Pyrus communis]|uniref:Mitochondrial-processing peptidase subunit alpha-like n=1 Tax=Pyrus ussuriensis x Pyrus communis TaxID=2448454 RepID=A0A5N5GS73_9ROSA|nr:mitochondrial-processing peptidase subunit alpha-like [Pyrus ussuriensis x Pyrus communis]
MMLQRSPPPPPPPPPLLSEVCFGWLIGEKSRSMPPLGLLLSGINLPPALPDHVQPVDVKITTLPNCVKIVSLRSEETRCDLAFKLPGGWHNERDAMTLNTLQALMGGGESFSAGGPGKGMHSRLYSRVLNRYSEFHSILAFSSIYNDTGIFGIQASTCPDFFRNSHWETNSDVR